MKPARLISLFLCVLLLMPAMVSCESAKPRSTVLFNRYDDYAHYVVPEGLLGADLSAIRAPLTSYDGYIGYGYNVVTKGYYNQGDINVSTAVLDTDKLVSDGLIYARGISTNKVSHVAGMTATSYESHLAVTAGLSYSNLVFKANFNSSFTSANKVSSNTSFVKTLISIGKQREYISLADISLDDLKKYTTGSFAKNINDPAFPAVQVLTTYGTHVLLDIELGGRMELNYMYNNANQISESELSTSASGAYKGVSASGSLNLSSEAKSFYSNSQFTASQLGGTATANITSLEKAQAAYGTWSQSLEDGSSVLEFIGAGDLSNPYAMLPVWYLAESQERRAEIETAYIALLDANGKYFNDLQDSVKFYVKDIYIAADSGQAGAKSAVITAMQNADPYASHVLINHDINDGTGGDWVYLGYTLTADREQAITGLMLGKSKNDDLPKTKSYSGATYHRTGPDITKGAGGDYYIYTYYTKDAAAGNPVTNIGFEIDKGNYTFLGNGGWSGWTSVGDFGGSSKLDLNAGSGGRYIYMWKRK